MAWGYGSPAPKPERRKTVKARRQRAERKVIKSVREQCEARDGYCRLVGIGPVDCRGASQWAHLEEHRRWKTRGMDPDQRHQRQRSAMLCNGHHDAYDAHVITAEYLTRRGADGPMAWHWPEGSYSELDAWKGDAEP